MHFANTDVIFCDGHRIKTFNAREPIQSKLTSCPRHQMGKENIQFRWHEIRTARAESQDNMKVDEH